MAVVRKKDVKVTRVVGGFQPAVCVGRGFGRTGIYLRDFRGKEILAKKSTTRPYRRNPQKQRFASCDHMVRVVPYEILKLIWCRYAKVGIAGKEFKIGEWKKKLMQACAKGELDTLLFGGGMFLGIDVVSGDVRTRFIIKSYETECYVLVDSVCEGQRDWGGGLIGVCTDTWRGVKTKISHVPYTTAKLKIYDENWNLRHQKEFTLTFADTYEFIVHNCKFADSTQKKKYIAEVEYAYRTAQKEFYAACPCPEGAVDKGMVSIWDVASGGYEVDGDRLLGYSNCEVYHVEGLECLNTLRHSKKVAIINTTAEYAIRTCDSYHAIDDNFGWGAYCDLIGPGQAWWGAFGGYDPICQFGWDYLDLWNYYEGAYENAPDPWLQFCDNWLTYMHRGKKKETDRITSYGQSVFIIKIC